MSPRWPHSSITSYVVVVLTPLVPCFSNSRTKTQYKHLHFNKFHHCFEPYITFWVLNPRCLSHWPLSDLTIFSVFTSVRPLSDLTIFSIFYRSRQVTLSRKMCSRIPTLLFWLEWSVGLPCIPIPSYLSEVKSPDVTLTIEILSHSKVLSLVFVVDCLTNFYTLSFVQQIVF